MTATLPVLPTSTGTAATPGPSLRARWLRMVVRAPLLGAAVPARDPGTGRYAGPAADAPGVRRWDVTRSPLVLSDAERRVALALAYFADADGCAEPGVARIALRARVHPGTVARALRVLDRHALVTRQRHGGRGGRPDTFHLVIPENGNGARVTTPSAALAMTAHPGPAQSTEGRPPGSHQEGRSRC